MEVFKRFRRLYFFFATVAAVLLFIVVPFSQGADIGTLGTQQRVLVICVKWKDVAGTRLPTANDWVNLLNNETNNFYNQATFNQTNFHFETPQGPGVPVDGWFTLDYNLNDFDDKPDSKFRTVGQAAIDLADPFVDFSQYHRVLVITNKPKFGGKGTQGPWWWKTNEGTEKNFKEDGDTVGKRLMTLAMVNEWEDGLGTAFDDAASVVAHELGHNVKVRTHYTDIKWFPGTKLDAVTPWDIMGESPSLNHFLGWAKADRQWIPAASVQTVGPPSGADIDTTITLKPQETGTNGVQAIKIPFTKEGPFQGYVVENRRKINGDENLPNEGVLISLVNENPDTVQPCLVVPDPGTPNKMNQAPLEVGDSFNDPTYNITINVVSQTGNDYKVRVQYKLPPNAKPDPMIIPWGHPPHETVDIWIDSEKNGWGTYKYTDANGNPVGNGDDAWVDHNNRVYVRVRNIGPGVATNVKVGVYRNHPPGMGAKGDDWKKVGIIVFPSILPGQTVEDYVKWKPTVGKHTCLKAIIEDIPGELSTANNLAQENVSHFYTTPGSPYKPVGLQMMVRNPLAAETTPVHFHVRDIPDGWTVSVDPVSMELAPGGIGYVNFTVYPPEEDRPGMTGKPKIEALVPYADTFISIGGVDTWVNLVNPTTLTLGLVSGRTVQVGQRVAVEGRLTPAIANARIAVEFSIGEQSEIVYANTDANGGFSAGFTPTTAGLWKAQAFYDGSDMQAPAESAPVRFQASGQALPVPGTSRYMPDTNARIMLDGGSVPFTDETAWLDRTAGRYLVPVRFVAENLGYSVNWDSVNRKVTITRGETSVELRVGDERALIGGRSVDMDTQPFITDKGRTMVPLRFITEAFGCGVEWRSESREISITRTESETTPTDTTRTATEPTDVRDETTTTRTTDSTTRDTSTTGDDTRDSTVTR